MARFLAIAMVSTTLAPLVEAQPYYQQGPYYQGGYYDQHQNYRDGSQGPMPPPGVRTESYPYGGRGWDERGERSAGGEMGRTVGGSVGLAAGMVGGAALASAVVSAGAIASMGPLAVLLIGSAITLGGGFLGAKLFSAGGQKLTEALGKQNTWMLIGAVAGTIAALALIPALGPFAGAGGLVLKGLIGGVVGGVIGRLFANQLEALSTPRNLMMGLGGVLGGMAGGIPGAVAGAAGGFALGHIFDDHFFSKPGEGVRDILPIPDLGRVWDRVTGAGRDVRDWASNRLDDSRGFWDERWYGQDYNDPYYQQAYQTAYYQGGRGPYYDPSPTGYAPYTLGADAPTDSRRTYQGFVDGMQGGMSREEEAARYRQYLESQRRGP